MGARWLTVKVHVLPGSAIQVGVDHFKLANYIILIMPLYNYNNE